MRFLKPRLRTLVQLAVFAALTCTGPGTIRPDATPTNEQRAALRETVRNEAWERREWMRERFGGELDQDFARRVLTEAAKERAKHPDHFRDTSGDAANPVLGATAVWRNLGPASSNKMQ